MWPNPQFPADLVTFTEEILNGKLHFLCSVKLKLKLTTILNMNFFHKYFSKVFVIFFEKVLRGVLGFQGHVFSITLVNNGCFAKFKRSGFCAYVSMFEAVYFRNGRFYFKVNNYKEREIDGVNFFFYLSKLNCLRKSKKHKHLRFCLSIKYKK